MERLVRGLAAAVLAALAVVMYRRRPVAPPVTEGSWEPADR